MIMIKNMSMMVIGKNDMKHGYGKLYDACGLYYDGHWQNDKKHGSGVIFNNIGIYYTGKMGK